MAVSKITSFEDLVAWQKAQDLAVIVYKSTHQFPTQEKFALVNQIRRAASSVSANIAEGFGKRTLPDKKQFYTIAYGSLLETKNFVYLSVRLDYLSSTDSQIILNHITNCQKLLNALMRSLHATA
jgi:four helix bundle protein